VPKQKPNEQVQQIPLSEIRPFKNHPFKVTDDELMQQTIDSIMQVGVLNPAIIRPAPEGGYEMVAGHRRLHAADLAGLKTIPAIVRNLDDDEAVILMVDSNLQRETISPMERAQAYKMKLEALKHQGKKQELQTGSTSPQVGEKSSWAVSIVANDANASRSQVQRLDCCGNAFAAKGKTVVQPGWKAYADAELTDKPIPELSEGQMLSVSSCEVKEGKTTPPKHFTDVIFCERKEWIGIEERSSA